jgi:hypothetical protein
MENIMKNNHGSTPGMLFSSLPVILLLAMAILSCSGPQSQEETSGRGGDQAKAPAKSTALPAASSNRTAIAPENAATGSILKNGDFSEWNGAIPKDWIPEGWTDVKTTQTEQTHKGKPVIEITLPKAFDKIYQVIAQGDQLKAGDELIGSVWVKASEPQVKVFFLTMFKNEKNEDDRSYVFAEHPGDGKWHQLVVKWQSNPAIKVQDVRFSIGAEGKISEPIYVSDANLKSGSSATTN